MPSIEVNDTWFMAEGEYGGLPNLIRGRGDLGNLVGHPDYPKRLAITWSFEDETLDGLPSKSESTACQEFEERLANQLEHDWCAINFVVMTNDGTRTWQFYCSDLAEVGRRINEEFGSDDKRLPIELASEDDPDWEEYQAMVNSLES